METKKTLAEKIALGGGIVLLPGRVVRNSPRNFVQGAAYSLGANSFYVERKGLASDVVNFLKLRRLENIGQLEFLSTLRLNGHGIRGLYPHTFGHNRLVHSVRVSAFSLVMAKAYGLSDTEIDKLVVSGLSHDVFTCAGGDSWKDVNQQGTLFDEDNEFARKIFLYFGENWKILCGRYGWDPEKMSSAIADIVSGQGLLGGFQEIADTASYMLGDVEEIRRAVDRHKSSPDFGRILQAAKRPWDIWNHLSVCGGRVVVNDPVRLNNFLALRLLLWVDLYQNPQHKFLELLMLNVVYPHMINRKLIKINELPTKDDRWLHGVISRHMGWAEGQIRNLDLLGSYPKLETFSSIDKALVFEEEKYQAGAVTLIYDVRKFQPTKTKIDKYYIVGKDGHPQTFANAYPVCSEVIKQMAQQSVATKKPVQMAWVERPNISDNFRLAWKSARARWQERK